MLLIDLLEQLIALNADKPDHRFGILLLDPKAALIEEMPPLMISRGQECTIINGTWLNANKRSVNLIDCALNPWELGRSLVLAAQGAGIGASDPFWFGEWTNLFGAAIFLLRYTALGGKVTLRQLVESLLMDSDTRPDEAPRRRILAEADRVERILAEKGTQIHEGEQRDALLAIAGVRRFYRQNYTGTIEAFIQRAYGAFARSEYDCFSGSSFSPIYDNIIENGDVTVVSMPPSEPDSAKITCSLVKLLFQQTVMARKERCFAKTLQNWTRPVLIACDEYSQIASEVPGQPAGDGQFYALAREAGCMGLLATQSVNTLSNSSLRDAWKSVFSTAAAKIFMSANDNETVEEASKLAGDEDWMLLMRAFSRNREGGSVSSTPELRERKSLPHRILTRLLKQREAVVIGSLDGRETQPDMFFMRARDRKPRN